MHPQIFGFVKSYGLLMAISFVLGLFLSIRRGRKQGLSTDAVVDLIFVVLVSSLIGVRLAFVLTHLDQFHPWYQAFRIWDGGLTLYGGIILAIAAVWWKSRRLGLPFLRVADVLAPGVILGIGVTRIGCFLAGCCFGHPTDCALGVRFPVGAPATQHYGDVAVHPAQLYASAAGFLVFALLLLWERRPSGDGATFGRFLMLYGVARFLLDFTRYYEADQVLLGLSNNQFLSLGIALTGLAIMVTRRRAPLGEEQAV